MDSEEASLADEADWGARGAAGQPRAVGAELADPAVGGAHDDEGLVALIGCGGAEAQDRGFDGLGRLLPLSDGVESDGEDESADAGQRQDCLRFAAKPRAAVADVQTGEAASHGRMMRQARGARQFGRRGGSQLADPGGAGSLSTSARSNPAGGG